MSVKAMAAVWDTQVKPPLKLVLLAYTDHADHDGRHIRPGQELVAHKTGYSVKSVGRVVAELRDLGLLKEDHPPRRGRATEYSVKISATGLIVPQLDALTRQVVRSIG